MIEFEAIEKAIKDKLKSEIAYLPTVETYAGEIDAAIEGAPITLPAAFVYWEGETLAEVDGKTYQHEGKFAVIVAASSFKTRDEARTGDEGAYQLVLDVQRSLTASRLGIQIDRIKPSTVELIAVNRRIASYAVRFLVTYDESFTNWDDE